MDARLALARAQMKAGLSEEAALDAACDGFVTVVALRGGLDIATIEVVARAVVESMFTPAHQHRIASVVAQGQHSEGHGCASRKNQHCHNIEDFLTSSVWDNLLDTGKSVSSKQALLAESIQGGGST